MKSLVTTIVGIAGMAAGWMLAAMVVIGLAGAFSVNDRDGGIAMAAFFAVGPAVGLICLVIGIWFALRWFDRGGLAPLMAHVLLAVLSLTILAAATAAAFWLNRPRLASNGLPPVLKHPQGDVVFKVELGATPDEAEGFGNWQAATPVQGDTTSVEDYKIRNRSARVSD